MPSGFTFVFVRLERFNRAMFIHPVRIRRSKVMKAANTTLRVFGCTTARTWNGFLSHGLVLGRIEPEGVSLSTHSSL
jgi:hypothetical protein